MSTEYYQIQQPEDLPAREREDAMGAYFMMFASLAAGLPLPIINLIAAIIYYHVNKHKSRFVRFHSLQSLLSQLPVSLLNAGLVVWAISFFKYDFNFDNTFLAYLIVVLMANLLYLGFSIVAAIKARKGLMYYFIFFGKLSYEIVYKIKEEEEQIYRNNPPI